MRARAMRQPSSILIHAWYCINKYHRRCIPHFAYVCLVIVLYLPSYGIGQTPDTYSSSLDSTLDSAEGQVLSKALYLRTRERSVSISLAKEAIRIATLSSNMLVVADANKLLAEIGQDANDLDMQTKYFPLAAELYLRLNDLSSSISASIGYIAALHRLKEFQLARQELNKISEIDEVKRNPLLLGMIYISRGDNKYYDKAFVDAIPYYKKAAGVLNHSKPEFFKERGDAFKMIAQSYKRLKDRARTAEYYKQSLDMYTALGDERLMARAFNTLADAERHIGNHMVALDYINRSLDLHHTLNDPIGKAKALSGAGIIYRHIGRYENSLDSLHEAYMIYKREKDIKGLAKSSNQIGLIYTRLKKFDQARSFYQATINLPAEHVEQRALASALRELAVIELKDKQFETALDMANRARDIYANDNDLTKVSLLNRIIGNVYRGKNNTKEAEKYYRQSLKLAIDLDNVDYQIKAQTPLAGVISESSPNEAITLLEQSIKKAKDLNNKHQQLYATSRMVTVTKAMGRLHEALNYASEESSLLRAIHKDQELNGIALAKAQLESYKLELELESLRERARLDQLELAKKNNEVEIAEQAKKISELEAAKNKYASVTLGSLLLACCIFAVYLYRRFIDSNKRNKELDYLATRDPLTNCYNRRHLMDEMSQQFVELEDGQYYSVILADIDHFKNINDTYGHSSGDSVIKNVAKILKNSVRKDDITCRYGGEEFCIVLPSAALKQAKRIAENMRRKIENSHVKDIKVTCSFGISSIELGAKSPYQLIEQADIALYKSKSTGRNRVSCWDVELMRENDVS